MGRNLTQETRCMHQSRPSSTVEYDVALLAQGSKFIALCQSVKLYKVLYSISCIFCYIFHILFCFQCELWTETKATTGRLPITGLATVYPSEQTVTTGTNECPMKITSRQEAILHVPRFDAFLHTLLLEVAVTT